MQAGCPSEPLPCGSKGRLQEVQGAMVGLGVFERATFWCWAQSKSVRRQGLNVGMSDTHG